MKRKRKRLQKAGWILLSVLLVLMLLPYLIPLSAPAAVLPQPPFSNSAFDQVNNVSFHYRVFEPMGTPKAKLLLLHGLGGSTFSFEEAAPKLSQQGILVLAVDLPGFGYSARTPDYDHSQAHRAKNVWQLLTQVDARLDAQTAELPWHLAGHSMGGGTAAAIAIAQPQRAASLILIDAALFETARGGFLMDFPPLSRLLHVAAEHLFLTEGRVTSFLTSAYGKAPTPAQVRGYLTPLRLPGTALAFSNMVKTAKNEDAGKLADINTPLLAVWGSEDTWVPLAQLEQIKQIRPDTQAHIIQGAAHCPMETHPDQFVTILSDWLLQ